MQTSILNIPNELSSTLSLKNHQHNLRLPSYKARDYFLIIVLKSAFVNIFMFHLKKKDFNKLLSQKCMTTLHLFAHSVGLMYHILKTAKIYTDNSIHVLINKMRLLGSR